MKSARLVSKLALLLSLAVLPAAGGASAAEWELPCQGDTYTMGQITRIVVSDDHRLAKIDYIDKRGKASSDIGDQRKPGSDSYQFKLRRLKAVEVDITTILVVDGQGRRLLKTQVRRTDGGNPFAYETILCQMDDRKEPRESTTQDESSAQEDSSSK